MKGRQRLWWVLGGVFLVFCVGIVFAAYRFGWSSTGFLSKSLWDWLQLLIVPLVLAIIAVVFQLANSRTERQIAKDRYEQDREIAKQRYEQDQQLALDKQREDLLQAYLDCLAELLLEKQLRSSAVDAEVRNFARVRTITVLFQLDARRIGYVFAFLLETGLMSDEPNGGIISMRDANLSMINLSQTNISRINLRSANLRNANLSNARLTSAELTGANLDKADLSNTNLSFANLSGASLLGANLSGVNLWHANLVGARFSGADLRNANLSDTNLRQADLAETIFKEMKGASFIETKYGEANLSGANLSKANLRGASFAPEQLDKAKSLKGAIMPDGSIHL